MDKYEFYKTVLKFFVIIYLFITLPLLAVAVIVLSSCLALKWQKNMKEATRVFKGWCANNPHLKNNKYLVRGKTLTLNQMEKEVDNKTYFVRNNT